MAEQDMATSGTGKEDAGVNRTRVRAIKVYGGGARRHDQGGERQEKGCCHGYGRHHRPPDNQDEVQQRRGGTEGEAVGDEWPEAEDRCLGERGPCRAGT